MKITVFGAYGGIGTHVVDLATQRGHQVRAVYRATPQTPPADQAEILVTPDIFDPRFAAQAIGGADVIITALGPDFAKRHNPRTTMISPPDLHQRLARTLIAAMKDLHAPARLISVGTGSMGPGDAAMGAGPRLLLPLLPHRRDPQPGPRRPGPAGHGGRTRHHRPRLVRAAPHQTDRRPAHRARPRQRPLRRIEDHLPRRRRLVHRSTSPKTHAPTSNAPR